MADSSSGGRRLGGKRALVTGGAGGIGSAICRRLARDGAAVIVNYAGSRDAAERLVAEIASDVGRAHAVKANITDPADVGRLFDEAEAALGGRLDLIVNNAGMFDMRPLAEIDAAHYEKIFNLNVRGPVLVTAEAARRMNDGGRVVCISSVGARQLLGGASVYSASKAAVEALVRCWAVDLGPRGITVNAVAPGTTATEAVKAGVPDDAKRALIGQTSLGRLGTPDDIANVVALLCSDDARWITGTYVDANGGLHA